MSSGNEEGPFVPTQEDRDFIEQTPHLKRAYDRSLKTRLIVKKSSPDSLKDLCFREIAANFEFYKLHGDVVQLFLSKDLKNDMLQFMLQNVMLNELYKEFLRKKIIPEDKIPSIENQHQLVIQLMNDKTYEIDMSLTGNEHWDEFGEHLEILWHTISKRAPNLQKFFLKCEYLATYPSPLASVSQPMMHLQSLTVEGWKWSDRDLKLLSNACPNLITLQLLFGDLVTCQGLQQLDLKKLQFFFFDINHYGMTEKTSEKAINFRNTIIQHMPWLKAVGCDLAEHFHRLKEDGFFFVYNGRSGFIPGEFQLEEIFVLKELPASTHLPNLQRLYFEGPYENRRILETIASFSNLTELAVGYVPSSQLAQMFESVGPRLTILRVENTRDFDLISTFYLCPNLIVFEFYGCKCDVLTQRTQYWPYLSANNFRLLKKVKISFFEKAPEGFLKFIFEAPLIEKIYFMAVIFRRHECFLIQDLQEDKLQNLRSLTLYPTWNEEESMASYVDHVASLLKFIVFKCPKIQKKSLRKWYFLDDGFDEMWNDRDDVFFYMNLAS